MKIRNRLTLNFLIVTACLMLTEFSLIYYFFKRHTERDFLDRLEQRASFAVETISRDGVISGGIYNKLIDKSLLALPNETEEVYQVDQERKSLIQKSEIIFPPTFIDNILNQGAANIRVGDIYYAGKLFELDHQPWIVLISAEDIYGRDKLDNLFSILLITFDLSLAILFLIGLYLSQQALSPISKIIAQVNVIRANNLHLRLKEGNGEDEIAKLAETFNNMLDRLETSFELQLNFINNASHELRNPLTAIIGKTEVALIKERSPDEYIDVLHSIEIEAHRLANLVNSLLRLAQTDQDKSGILIENIRIDELLCELKDNFNKTHPDNNIQLDFKTLPDQSDQLTIKGNYSLLNVAFNNVLDNACKFSQNRMVQIQINQITDHFIEISVVDQGLGIPQDEMPKIMEPFFRGSNVKQIKGFGFGLPLASKIVKIHRGSLQLSSNLGVGTRVTITLPTIATHLKQN